MEPLKRWTVLVYIAADVPERDMRQSASKNLEQMRSVGSTDAINVAAQADFTDQPTERYWFPPQPDSTHPDVSSCVQQTLDNVDSGSKNALLDFLKWGTATYPARNFMFVFWGHGYGLDDYNPFPKHVLDLLRPDSDFYKLEPTDTSEPLLDEQALEVDLERYWSLIENSMPDFTSKSVLLNSDIGAALREIKAKLPLGQQLAIVGMDACTMAMAEVWYEMTAGPSIAIGSEYSIPVTSWPYDLILSALGTKPDMQPSELATATIDCYVAYYSQPKTKGYVTLSACDLVSVSDLAESVEQLVQVLLPECEKPEFRRAVFHARNRTLEFDSAGFIDLRNFCELLQSDAPDSGIAAAGGRVMRAVDSFVIANKWAPADGSKLSRAKGVSAYFPRWIENYDPKSSIQRDALQYLSGAYSSLQFAKRTGWHRFLLRMLGSQESVMSNPAKSEKKEAVMPKKKGKGRTNPKGRKTAKKKI